MSLVNKKQNVVIDSRALRGGQGKYISKLAALGLRLRQHCNL